MSDFHDNIFYYYRGPLGKDKARERQLEDNTTKALVNTLRHSSPAVRRGFLNFLGMQSDGNVNFALQKQSIGEGRIRTKRQRLLLGIVPTGSEGLEPTPTSDDSGDGRPDAWIWGDDFVVLIESKVVGGLDPQQMARHREKLTVGSSRPTEPDPRTWGELHGFFHNMAHSLTGKDAWLVKQFTQYLEHTNMSGFVGFDKEMFDYFFTLDDEDTRRWVKSTVAGFAEKVAEGLKDVSDFYEGVDVGNLKRTDSHCWAAFGPATPKGSYRQMAHQTLAISTHGIEVFINIELKRSTDKLKKLALCDRRTFDKQIRKLAKSGPFVIRVIERIPKRPRVFASRPVADLESDYLIDERTSRDGLDYLANLLEQIPLPYVSFRRLIPRQDVLTYSRKDKGGALVKAVVTIMKSFHPFVEYVNGESERLKRG